jgi:hypothetical protein
MRKILIILFISFPLLQFAQPPVGSWRDHYAYNRGHGIALSANRIFVAVNNGVFWYNPTDGSIGKISSVNGLNDVAISAIGYSPHKDLLVVGYENGNIDLVLKDRVVNIPYIYQKPMQGSKRINHFNFNSNGQVLVSTGFGIVVLDAEKFEIKDTYYIGDGGSSQFVYQTIFYNNKVYAATDNGLFSAFKDDPLLIHFSSWSLEVSIPGAGNEYNLLSVFGDKLIVNQKTGQVIPDVIRFFDGFTWTTLTSDFNKVNNLWSNQNVFIVTADQGIATYNILPGAVSLIDNYPNFYAFRPVHAVIDQKGNMAIADNEFGLVYKQGANWNHIMPNSPYSDLSYFVMPTNTDLFVAAGGRNDVWGNQYHPLSFHKLSQNQWRSEVNYNYFDAVRITPSPFHSDEYFVSSWGDGVVVYRDGVEIERYGPHNSSLETIIPGSFCRIGGVTFDSKGNMWVTNSSVNNPLSVRTPDGTWTGFPYSSIYGITRTSDITVSPSQHLWVVLPSGGGLFVLNPGSTPSLLSSHTARSFKPFDSEGAPLPSDIYSLAFDRDGYLWLGTNEGVLVSYNPQRVMESSAFSIQRVKIPDVVQGLAVYLLESEIVTSIAVDGGNRKWLGTQRSGVFLQSADGSKQILHFTKDNSPLPSNNIQHIGIHPKTGEVFFATEKGLVSYRGEATEPSEKFGKVYAFPNPVRPNYDGVITITGLVDKTTVKITDIGGNLVYETLSLGGQAIWDGKNLNGRKVSTGVYLFFCSDSKGEQSAVGKILFVK